MKGRPPKPTYLKVVTGNPGKRKLNSAEAVPPSGMPTPPTFLSKEALTEWRRICPLLYKTGLVTRLDRVALAAYCVSYGRLVQAERVIAEMGPTITTPAGFQQAHPLLAVARRAASDCVKYGAELGLSPSSRSRVAASPPRDPNDPASKYFDR